MNSTARLAKKLRPCRFQSAPSLYDAKRVLRLLNFLLHPTLYSHHTRLARYQPIGMDIRRFRRALTRFIAQGIAFGKKIPCGNWRRFKTASRTIAQDIVEMLPALHAQLLHDIEAAYHGDPASRSEEEIVLAYPAISAVTSYRIAHELWEKQVPIIPRMLTEYVHGKTGIDIHPAARIGRAFFIDHGTGVVIGETSIIGDNVRIYQGVTLGALSVPSRNVKGKRHPTIEDNVIIYAGATILGGNTVIGKNSIIGGNTWITSSIPPHSKILRKDGDVSSQLEVRIT